MIIHHTVITVWCIIYCYLDVLILDDIQGDDMDVTKFNKYCIAIVSKDSVEFDNYIDVYPIELQPVTEKWKDNTETRTIEISDNELGTNIDIRNIEGNIEKINIIKHTNIKAKWYPEGDSNRIEAPNVYQGERVMLYRYGNTDKFYWTLFDNDFKYRKLEKRTITLSNRDYIANNDDDMSKTYEMSVDTINKICYLKTDDSNGEYTTHTMTLDTLEGIFDFIDGKGNQMLLESQDDKLTLNILKQIDINTSDMNITLDKLSITNSVAELVQTLSDLIQANIDERHIGNLGIPTTLTGSSTSVYQELKAKVDSFI